MTPKVFVSACCIRHQDQPKWLSHLVTMQGHNSSMTAQLSIKLTMLLLLCGVQAGRGLLVGMATGKAVYDV